MSVARSPSHEELEGALSRLCVYATTLTKYRPQSFQGITPNELVSETFLRFFESPNGLRWDGERDLGIFLCGVLRNVSYEARRSRWNKFFVSIHDVPDGNLSPVDPGQFEPHPFLDQVMVSVAGDGPLEELVKAALVIEPDGRNTNQKLAEETRRTVKQIEIDKKRLKRRLLSKMGEELAQRTGRKSK